MGTTANYGWPYPELTDPPDGPAQIKALAVAADATVATNKTTAARARLFTTTGNFVFPNSQTSDVLNVTLPVNRFTAVPVALGTCDPYFTHLRVPVPATNVIGLRAFSTTILNLTQLIRLAFSQQIEPGPPLVFVRSETPPTDPDLGTAVWTVATCHTPHCGNADIPLEFWWFPGTAIVCGVCSQPITDVQPQP